MASGRCRDPSSCANSGMNLRHHLNATQGREEGDLRAKLVAKVTVAVRLILSVRSEARIPRSVQMEQLLPRYQIPFTLEIERMEPPEKFIPPKFTIYDSKSDLRFGLTFSEKLWDDLMPNPPNELRDLMSRLEMYARLEDKAHFDFN
ncbi:hypothetical protein Acr_12g0000430 [Actinidia rufa]|uniref:Uncharacterized protein n=1 Tax=Actinidia rufa TaxID=165716 RepID=A0A7J0FFN3_9ERIC|nr:hypothetical protein Acr_12g0000430 [Actinidia rufa]